MKAEDEQHGATEDGLNEISENFNFIEKIALPKRPKERYVISFLKRTNQCDTSATDMTASIPLWVMKLTAVAETKMKELTAAVHHMMKFEERKEMKTAHENATPKM